MASSAEDNPDFCVDLDFDDLEQLDENAFAEIDDIENKEINAKPEPDQKKARFEELEEKALDDIVASAPSKKTNYTTKWGVSVFRGENFKSLYFS